MPWVCLVEVTKLLHQPQPGHGIPDGRAQQRPPGQQAMRAAGGSTDFPRTSCSLSLKRAASLSQSSLPQAASWRAEEGSWLGNCPDGAPGQWKKTPRPPAGAKRLDKAGTSLLLLHSPSTDSATPALLYFISKKGANQGMCRDRNGELDLRSQAAKAEDEPGV